MDHVFKDLTNIREAQIVQSRPGELEVRVVRGGAYTALDERELLKGGPSGKLRFVVSEIPDAKLENAAK